MSDQPVFVRVLCDKGKVVALFSEEPGFNAPIAVDRWVMDPEECLDITEAMATAAFEAREGFKPVGDALKAELIERHRMKLTQRLALVLNTKRDDKRIQNGKLAQDLVEICLREIF